MQITFFDTDQSWQQLLPLTYTRPAADLRIGILKIREKWSHWLEEDTTISYRTRDYLTPLFPGPTGKTLHILGSLLPTPALVEQLRALKEDEVLTYDGQVIAGYFDSNSPIQIGNKREIEAATPDIVHYPWDIFRLNGDQIRADFALVTEGRSSLPLSDSHTHTYGDQIFLEEGATVRAATLNAENGPIYIGKDADIQEGALVRGPFALCEHAVLNMGAKMRGDSTIGPYSKVGGEIANSVIQGYSNKGHDGFLGNSVIGEWCNIGADTNNSNLKNNYANVKMWDFATGRFKDTGLQFCGLIMGDHSKCGINTMFNTATTVGVSANIYGDGFPRTFIASFSWGGAAGFTTFQPKKAFETAELMMARRGKTLTDEDKSVLTTIFEETAQYRVWEKK